jgi:hypothetical protein
MTGEPSLSAEHRTRVLIVDDSAVMRSLLRAVVCSDSSLEVAGTAADGASALQAIDTLHPDLVDPARTAYPRPSGAGDHVLVRHPARRARHH